MASQTQELLPLFPVKFEMSSTIGNLVEALAKARKAFKPVIKDMTNPFYKSNYADLASVIEATKDGLSDNGLAVVQPLAYNRDGFVQITTFLAHSSGEWFKSILDMPIAKVDAQGVGAGTTYGRRYAYSAMVNVASEEDDDANGAVSKPYAKKGESDEQFDQRTEGERNLAVFQVQAIDEACKRAGKTEAEIVAYLGLLGEKRIEHLKRNQFDGFLKWANSNGKKATVKSGSAVPVEREAANKRLWALAAKYQISEQDVKQCAYEKYQVKSMTELSTADLEGMCQWVEEVAAAVRES